jgi:RHS repeat-associated protein
MHADNELDVQTDDIHDSESNLEHTLFRQLSGTQGRWMTPDPYLGSVDITNPQSLNQYAYVLNDPVNRKDPLGLEHCEKDGDDLGVDDSQQCENAGGTWVGADGSEPNDTVSAPVGDPPPEVPTEQPPPHEILLSWPPAVDPIQPSYPSSFTGEAQPT